MHEMLKRISFILLLFLLYFLFSFYYGKLGMMGNFVGEEKNEVAQGMWNIFQMELTNH